MICGADLRERLQDPPVTSDHVSDALGQLDDEQIGYLDIVQPAELTSRVGQQVERERLLAPEPPVRRLAVEADAQQDRIPRGELGLEVAEPASLRGSTRRPVLREEEEYDLSLPDEVVEPDLQAVLVARRESRRLGPLAQH